MYREFLNKLNIEYSIKITKFNNIYNSYISIKNTPFTSFGKGFTKEEALITGLGELCERLITKNLFEDYYINNLYHDQTDKKEFLNSELKQIYQIEQLEKEDLIDFNSDSQEILSIPFSKTLFPINIIQNLYASNGMSAHFNEEKSYQNAKLEIIERFVKFKVIKEAIALPKISHYLNSSKIQVYDASLNQYPVIAISYIDKNRIILAFGASLNQEEAIKKAYLELMQTSLKTMGRITNNLDEVKDSFNLEKHFINLSGDVHINTISSTKNSHKKWTFSNLNLFEQKEYIRVIKKQNIYTTQIIIPSISEVYPIDDLVFNNKNYYKFIREDIFNYRASVLDEIQEYEEIGALIGVIFEKEIFKQELTEIIKNKNKFKFHKKYINLIKLSRRIDEV